MIVAECLANRRDLPVWHFTLIHVSGVAARDGHVVAPSHLQELRRIFDGPHDQRGAPKRILRVREGGLNIDLHDAGLLAEPDRDLSVAPILVIIHSGSSVPHSYLFIRAMPRPLAGCSDSGAARVIEQRTPASTGWP
jgi:hypothetical protein